MIGRIDDVLRSKRNFVLLLIACVVFAGAYALAVQEVTAHASEVAADKARTHAAAVEAARKRALWTAHLRREAWDRAHPQIVAQRKAVAKAKAEALAGAVAARLQAQREQSAREEAARREQQAKADKLAHACDTALDYEKQSVKDIDAGSYQDAYDNATHGLDYNESCDNDTAQMVNKGYLLSMKGMAEHHLSVGDSRTDLNQANALLVECQTTPGLYGTKTAASCETQEEYNIRAQNDWDMQSYEQ